jgi:hypothetical protein
MYLYYLVYMRNLVTSPLEVLMLPSGFKVTHIACTQASLYKHTSTTHMGPTLTNICKVPDDQKHLYSNAKRS